jgi:allantoicase
MTSATANNTAAEDPHANDAAPYGGGDPYADYRSGDFAFTELVDLADRRLGAGVIAANDEFFAERENLLVRERAVFDPEHFGHKGKIMDGWETRRRRVRDTNDWVRFRLVAQGAIRAVEIDTAYLKGNSAGWIALSGRNGQTGEWFEIIPRTRLQPDTLHRFRLPAHAVATHVRLDAFPDGGVARMRLHGALTERGAAELRRRYTELTA